MSFQTWDYSRPDPSAFNPLNNLIPKALGQYMQMQKASYLPKQMEADIFAKKFSPMASLATSPAFMNDPVLQENLRNLLRQQGMFGGNKDESNYTNPLLTEAIEAKELGKKLTKAGTTNIKASSAAGWLERNLGETGKFLNNIFTGGGITNELANDENKAQGFLDKMKKNAILTHQMTPEDADKRYQHLQDETWEQTFDRVMKLNPLLYSQLKNLQQKNSKVETSSNYTEIAQSFGKTVPEVEAAAKYFKTSPKNIISALQAGVKSDEEFKDYLKGIKNG